LKKSFTFLFITPIICISACGPVTNPNNVFFAQSDLVRDLEPVVNEAQMGDLAVANTEFAFNFFDQIRDSDGNLIFSPLSLSLALSMAMAGAEGDTRQEMVDALSLQNLEEIDPAFNALLLKIESSEKALDEESGTPFQLNIANSSWSQSGFEFKQPFLDTLAMNYGAGMYLADFSQDPEAARQAINDWVEDETEDKIKDLIPQGAIKPLTRLVLANAIYFNGAWLYPFQENGTQPAPFTLLDGTQVSVDMMKLSDKDLAYYRGENYQAVRLPYQSKDFSMLLVLPDEGIFEEVQSQLGSSVFPGLTGNFQYTPVNLRMPKFDFETALNANEVLKQLGMQLAFIADAADFSGMTDAADLYISDVVHKATITVDEFGTEAAAATAVIMVTKSMPISDPVSLILDRPFFFAIEHQPTGTILFLGRVVAP